MSFQEYYGAQDRHTLTLHTDSLSLPLTKAPRSSLQCLPLGQLPGESFFRATWEKQPSKLQGFSKEVIPQRLTLWENRCALAASVGKTPGGQQVTEHGNGRHSTVGCCGSCWSKASRMLVRWERDSPAFPWRACPSALPPAMCQLCSFPDLTFGEILRSCLNHFLSRPHFQFWEAGARATAWGFSHLAHGRLPSYLALSGLGPFLKFFRLLTDC